LKVLHLSDIHMTPTQKKKQEWLKSLAALSPDFVVVTGDFLAHMKSVPVVLDALAPLLSIPGAFVFGSNDYYAPSIKNPARYLFEDDGTRIHGDELPWGELKAALESHGWIDLTHVRRDVRIGDVAFEFRGVDDAHLERDDYSKIAGAVPSSVVGIGVSHAPYLRVLDGMSSDGVDLIFAGHTHGGQLRIPFYGSLVTNCDLDNARSRGLSRHKSSWLHVSAGIGTNPYTPVRFACRPEATLIHLVAKN
jgi:predicted MPP superfamily phosphohydrolase